MGANGMVVIGTDTENIMMVEVRVPADTSDEFEYEYQCGYEYGSTYM